MAEAGDLKSPESGFESQSGHVMARRAGYALNLVATGVALVGCAAPSAAPAPTSAEVTSVVVSSEAGFPEVVAEGLVLGVSEDGGRCRFTFWADNGAASRLTGEGAATSDGTRCGPVSERAGTILPLGHYEVELRYDSATGSIASPRIDVEIEG